MRVGHGLELHWAGDPGAELGVGVSTAHPLLGERSDQEPDPEEVRTRVRPPSGRKGLH